MKNTETIFFKAQDGVILNGIMYKNTNKTAKIIISVHGMATNCIKKRDEIIAKKANEINIDFLAFNNRGHDLVNYIKKESEEKPELAGTAYEEIAESYEDIVGAINYAIEQGYKEIYIIGHSLGCTKTIYTYNKLIEENEKGILEKIKGIILLSLVDIPLAIQVYLKDDFPVMVTYAKNMKREKMENQLMPAESFIHPISVKTFLRYAIENKDIDFAKFSDKNYNFEELNNIKVPLFMRWGNQRELIIQEADKLCEQLKGKIKNDKLDIGYIDGADHSYTGKEEAPEFMKAEVESFIEGLYEDQKQGEKVKVTCTKSNEGFATAGGVQYVACAGNFKDAGLEYTGALKVLQMIFSYEYLWIQIRVKGGAYGCMCSFSDQGDSMFVTYRDPNLSESYKVYDEAADYVADFDADDRDMKKYIIGTNGSMDMPMEAVDMGARSFHAYFLGKTEADLQKVRDQVLSCTQEDIRALAPIVKAVVEAGNRCCIGNEEKIDQNKEYFDEVKHVL